METTPLSSKAWSPDVTAVAPADAVPDALILQTSTISGEVEGDEPAVRVQYVDDAAAQFTGEGDAIPEADPDLAECVVHTGKVTQLIPMSREQFRQPNAQALIAQSVRRAVTRVGNLAYVTQAAPVAPAVTPPAGLANVDGINTGTVVAENLDALIDLQATLATNHAMPTHFLLSPTAWASLRKFKQGATTSENVSLLGAGTEDVQRFLLDVPVIVSPAVSPGTGLLVDKTSIVSAVGTVNVTISEHFYFNRDAVGIRCTWRFGANMVHPDRNAVFTVTPPA